MFSFTLTQKFRAEGVSPDMIMPTEKSRFDGLFSNKDGKPILQGRLQVRLNEKAIRFFFYEENSEEKDRDTRCKIESSYKEIFSISLRDNKETDFDILHLGNQCNNKSKSITISQNDLSNIQEAAENLVGIGESGTKILFNFPFITDWEKNHKTWADKNSKNCSNKDNKWFVFFIQCCFLYFILDLENRESDLAKSPYYDEVRDRLRKSMIYKLLCTKIKYTIYLFKGEEPNSQDEYSYKTSQYAELLMSNEINEAIPSYCYKKENNCYNWFYNPEKELELLIQTNATFTSKKKEQLLETNLLTKIRNFFFKKHAVISATKVSGLKFAKPVYICYLILITIFSSLSTICLFWFDEDCPFLDYLYNCSYFWLGVAGVALGILIVLAIINDGINIIMPRVLVALGIGWLTAFISEDLIKSQLQTSFWLTLVLWVGVITIVGLLLFEEAKQHSAYYNIWSFSSSSWKLFPVIIHSYFWAVVLGVIMQFTIYPGLLENSEALPEIVFEDTFDEAENYSIRLTNFKDALIDYRQDLEGMFVKAAITGVVQGYYPSIASKNGKAPSFMTGELNYGKRELEKIRERGSSKTDHIIKKYESIRELILKERSINNHTALKSRYGQDTIILHNKNGQIKTTLASVSFGDSLSFALLDDKLIQLKEGITSIYPDAPPPVTDSTINNQLKWLDELIEAAEEEVQRINVFISDNNDYNTLIKWSYNDIQPLNRSIHYDNILINEAKHKHYFSRKVGDNLYLFPRMLILHVLIVLIIAFVGQLIISDKSVTEPL